jgi:GNAT superfamily N-acetyltransferase
MTSFSYRLATAEDASLLAENRINFLSELVGRPAEADVAALRDNMVPYFETAIPNGEYVCCLAYAGPVLVGVGAVVLRKRPGSFRNPTGWEGYVMNMYTHPDYRRQGIGRAILDRLIEAANERGVTFLELNATPDGAPLYQKRGFYAHSEPTMRLFVN